MAPFPIESGANVGRPSKTKCAIAEGAKKEAQQRVTSLLSRFPAYPQLDLALLQKCLE